MLIKKYFATFFVGLCGCFIIYCTMWCTPHFLVWFWLWTAEARGLVSSFWLRRQNWTNFPAADHFTPPPPHSQGGRVHRSQVWLYNSRPIHICTVNWEHQRSLLFFWLLACHGIPSTQQCERAGYTFLLMPECQTVRHLIIPVPEWTKMSIPECSGTVLKYRMPAASASMPMPSYACSIQWEQDGNVFNIGISSKTAATEVCRHFLVKKNILPFPLSTAIKMGDYFNYRQWMAIGSSNSQRANILAHQTHPAWKCISRRHGKNIANSIFFSFFKLRNRSSSLLAHFLIHIPIYMPRKTHYFPCLASKTRRRFNSFSFPL
jgi:hypothetical protein